MRRISFFFPVFILVLLMGSGCGEAPRRNLLGEETSPYLLQHAENPVHWQPWSDAIWDMARKEDKLVLISIGYSSCHWCHVMEEETFEDDSVARLMNERFINVKVDREERPDVDQVYMTAVQLMTGRGGWPLNVLVLPDGKPLYGGTYHTREQWMGVLAEMDRLYREDPARAREYADKVAQGVAQTNSLVPAADTRPVRPAEVTMAVLGWKANWDLQWGGNAGQQKFMMPANMNFLLDYAYLSADSLALTHTKNTLDKMARGGVFDQVGGGFYRYSTDAQWRVPHFEKMLYDNAQLLGLYSRAYKWFPSGEYRETAWRIFEFLQREMKSPDGGYYAALDADSEGEEGAYYIWDEQELKSVLGEAFPDFAAYYDIRPETAWVGSYIPFRPASDSAFVASRGWNPEALKEQQAGWRDVLMDARGKRQRPGVDNKVLTSWNALLVSGLAEAYEAFGEVRYLDAGEELFAFLLEHQFKGEALRHSSVSGVAGGEGFLEDYAFLAEAAMRLYEVSGQPVYLEKAERLVLQAEERFASEESGLLRYTETTDLISPILKTDDGVIPSANAAMAGLYLKLGHFHYRPAYLERSRKMVLALRERFGQAPQNYSAWGRLMLAYSWPYFEVAVAGPRAGEMRMALGKEFLPNALLVFTTSPSDLPLYANRYEEEATLFYVCRDHSCRFPVETPQEAMAQIQEDLQAGRP